MVLILYIEHHAFRRSWPWDTDTIAEYAAVVSRRASVPLACPNKADPVQSY